jgi:xanthosine phosphorylase
MPAGSLMMVNDHINMSGVSPLAGPNDEAYGPRFPDLSMAYPVAQRELLSAAAKRLELTLHEGVFLMVRGPHFETPAEIRAFQHMGADVVGMSMVPEVILANHCGLTVAAVAMVTNLGAGMTEGVLSHEETLSEGAKAAGNMAKLLAEYLPTA